MRDSHRARLFKTCLTGAVLAASAPAWGQASDAPVWKPRAEVEVQAGDSLGVSTSLFAPVAQNDSALIYLDGRIGYDERFDRNGSATLGARLRTGEDTAIGVNVGADFYRSDIGARDQAVLSMGLEGFSSVFDVRANFRLPLSKTQTVGFLDPASAGAGALVIENNRLIERLNGFRLEAIPLQGFNGEAGVRLPVGEYASIRGSAGGFSYWDHKADESYRGVRAGLELDIADQDSGTRFTFGGVVEHDNRFGTDARATVRLSVPFGGRAGDRGGAPTGLDRQMGDRVRRDYTARSGSRYTDLSTSRFAVDARTGNPFGGIFYASGTSVAGAAGTLEAPTAIADAVSRASANGIVVALGSGGTIATPGVTLANNQYLLGGAGTVDVRLSDGSTAQYGLGGTNGVIIGSSAAGAAVTLGQGSVIRDLTVRGAGVGIAANGVGSFAIERTIVENTGGAGISLANTLGAVSLTGLTVRGGAGAGVLVNGGSSVSLANSTISGGASAIDINDGGANLTTSLSNLTLSASGGNVLDIDGSGAGTVTVSELSGITIRGGTGETGGLSVSSATFDASTATTGIQTVNARRMEVGTADARVNGQGVFLTDVTGSLSFADLDIANTGATGLRVVNSKANNFTLATLDGTVDTVGGTAADLDPLVIDLTFASMSSAGAAGPGVILNAVQGGGTSGNALTVGTLNVSNSGGGGLVILNSTGLVRVNGGAITNSGGSSVRVGEQGIAGSGGSTTLAFGASIIDPTGAAPTAAIFNTSGTLDFTGPISGTGPILVQDSLAGSAIRFGVITLTGTAGDAITLDNLAGSINFAGLVTIANPDARGIVVGNILGGVTFGNVDITGLGDFAGLDVTGAQGNMLFNTLDITGTGVGKGIDLTGSTNAGNVIVLNASTIAGVNIGADLTQANMTGQFRFGDGDAAVLDSSISANTPIVIALMNSANGSYNFADATLVGDFSNLTGASFTAYYAQVGATGAGTRSDPGSLAGAEASAAQYIVLLNDLAGGQDVFDAASAGGSFDLAAGQSLVSFLNGDYFAVSSAVIPANLIVSGVGPAGITNVYAGSGAAILTSSTAGLATVNLASNSTIDGLVIRNGGGDVGVAGSGVSNARILNSDISGATGAITIRDGGVTSSVQLLHLDLASAAGTTLALNGVGAGTLTVSGADIDIAATGSSAALSLTDVTSGGLDFGTIIAGTSANEAVSLQNVSGGNVVASSVAVGGTALGAGVSVSGSSSATVIHSISVNGSAGNAVQLANNSGAVTIGSLDASATTATGLAIQNSQGAVTIGGGTISGAATGMSINGVAIGASLAIGPLNIAGTTGSGIALADVDGSVTFTGTTVISGMGTSGIVFDAGSAGAISFGDVNITGLGAGTTGVDARNASGTVNFNTLDIAGSSATGTRGIDLTGATFGTNFATADSGSITGVGIGVDLTNAAITGIFRYGDGLSVDADGAASAINGAIPIAISGLNGAVGTYNFADVTLAGDTSALGTSPTVYYVLAGAIGAGTLSDPGSLAAADASTAAYIILLDSQAGGGNFDTLGGTISLADNQGLLSFRDVDTFTVGGGAPANVTLLGIATGVINNPYAGSGAPLLTSADPTGTVQLGGTSVIDGVVVSNTGIGAGIFANGNAGIATIRNSTISGGGAAIDIRSGAFARTLSLQNLTLANAGNQAGALLNLNGAGGTLTITDLSDLTLDTAGGETAGLVFDTVIFDSDLAIAGAQAVNAGALTIGTAGARAQGDGLRLTNVSGSLTFSDLDIANNGGTGLLVANSKVNSFLLTTLDGTADTTGGTAVNLDPLTVNMNLSSVTATGGAYGILLDQVDGSFTVNGTVNVTGATTAGIAIQDNVAQATPLTATFNGAVTINNTSGTGLSFTNNAGATISFAGGGTGIDVATSSGAGLIAAGGGTFSFAGAGNSIQTATGQIANFTGITAGASGINFASLQSTGVVVTTAINFNNFDSAGGAFSGGITSIAGTGGGNDAIFIGNGSAANITFGATTIGTGANTVGGDGIEINGSGNGVVTFTNVDIDNTTAHGVSIAGAAGATGAIAINGGTIGAGGAGSITGDAVNITGGGGNVTVAASIAKTSAGNVVEVSSHTGGTVTFSNNISATGGAANGILLSNNTGGSIIFSGASKTLNTGTNNAIQFDNNAATGAAVSFTGGNLDIDTTSGRGITGTATNAGAGSLTIQGANNTITSAGGIALNLVNTNIASGGLNFLSISADGGTRGIVLNTTGAAAGLTVTGTGTTDGSGGTIQNITQRGIELLNTAQVSIRNLNLTNASTTGQVAGQDLDITAANGAIYMSGVSTAVFENINITGTIADNGITGINVSNFQLNNSLITGAGDGANESGIEFSNLSGTSSLTNTEIALSETNSLDIVNTDVNLNLRLNNVIFRDTQSSSIGEGGLQFRSFSSAAGMPTTNIDVVDSDFLRLRTQGIQIIGEDDSFVSADITNSVIDSQMGIGAGIDINGNDNSTVRFNIIGNPTIRSSGGAAINITSFGNANVMGRIANNADVEVYSQAPAGTGAAGSGVRLLAQENSRLTVAVTGNTLTQGAGNNSAAVDVIAREGSARLDLTLTGNVIDSADVNTLADINIQSGSSSGSNIETNQIYANIANNNQTGTAALNLLRLRVSELDNTHDPRIFLQGFVEGGAGLDDDAVATWNANGNTPGATAANIAVSLTGTATGPSAGAAQTPTNPLP